jgi:chromosome segregation ATPase
MDLNSNGHNTITEAEKNIEQITAILKELLLGNANAEISSTLPEKICHLRRLIETLESSVSEMTERVTTLETEKTDLSTEVKSQEQLRNHVHTVLKQLRREIDDACNCSDSPSLLLEEVDRHKLSIGDFMSKIRIAKRQAAPLENRLAECEGVIEQLKCKKEEQEQLQRDIKSLDQNIKRNQDRLDDEQALLKERLDELSQISQLTKHDTKLLNIIRLEQEIQKKMRQM